MKFKNLNFLLIITYLLSSSFAYSIDLPDIKNIIIHKEKKKINNIEFFNSESKKVSLNEFNSNLVIINFWATWCAPCKEEMPHLNNLKLIDEFKEIEIIPINIADEELRKSIKFFKDLDINHLEIFYGSSIDLAKEFKLRGIPTTIFIDKEGFEFARVMGFIDFENKAFLDWLKNHI